MDEVAKKDEVHEYKGQGIFKPLIDIKDYLFKIIEAKGPITRPELVKETGIPRSTIYDTLVKLMMNDKVRKFSRISSKRGRPSVLFQTWK